MTRTLKSNQEEANKSRNTGRIFENAGSRATRKTKGRCDPDHPEPQSKGASPDTQASPTITRFTGKDLHQLSHLESDAICLHQVLVEEVHFLREKQ